MKHLLEQAGYCQHPLSRTWSRADYGGINYSDGAATEERIAALVARSKDLSVLSGELKALCVDWPSTYHLGSNRANVLRPFAHFLANASVLEIGAGCGAITRFLGESQAQVLALEGSPRRAAIARDRTRDLPNVEVLAERFDQFQTSTRFDVVTLIGVLEYASMFTTGDQPTLKMLRAARELLKPSGVLIIAIENQFGLKYFAGAPEDHLWVPMYGIEDQYQLGEPQTFGRVALAELIEAAGFHHSNFLAPFPDYKLPASIITEAGFAAEAFDHSALAVQTARRDLQLPDTLAFSTELAWPTLAQNKLSLDLANSFLVLAHNDTSKNTVPPVLAFHYSTERHQAYCKETTFLQDSSGRIEAHYKRLCPQPNQINKDYIHFQLPQKSDYVLGRPFSERMLRMVSRKGWTVEDVADCLLNYLETLNDLGQLNLDLSRVTLSTRLPGEYVDMLPQNLIVRTDGTSSFIDKEWELVSDLPLGWLLFRSLLLLVQSVSRFGKTSSRFTDSRSGFIRAVMCAMQLPVSAKDLQVYGRLEAELQSAVSGLPISRVSNWWADSPLPRHNLSSLATDLRRELNEMTIFQAQLHAELDAASADLKSSSTSLEHQIQVTNEAFAQIHDKNQELHHLRGVYFNAQSGRGAIKTLLRVILKRVGLFRVNELNLQRKLQRSGLFDANYYLATYPDVAASGINPLLHYVRHGAMEGRNPSATFHADGYINRYADVRARGLNPLLHYVQHGRQEGRNTSFPVEPTKQLLRSTLEVVPFYLNPFQTHEIAFKLPRIAIHLNLARAVLSSHVLAALNQISQRYDLFVSLKENENPQEFTETYRAALSQINSLQVRTAPNSDEDHSSLSVKLFPELLQYPVVGHFALGMTETVHEQEHFSMLCGPTIHFQQVFQLLADDAGLVFCSDGQASDGIQSFSLQAQQIVMECIAIARKTEVVNLADVQSPRYHMFWVRGEILAQANAMTQNNLQVACDNNTWMLLVMALASPLRCYRIEFPGRNDGPKPFYEGQQDYSAKIVHKDIKVLAYYLPQFHPTPENDAWHGPGFTEWHKVRAANPLFEGHYQQHIPHPDLGYYLLDNPGQLLKQAEMMKKAGVHGLIFYHYWFSGRMILEKPAQMLLAHPEIQLPFSFCWANENWTRRWDGNENEILLGQVYSLEDARAFIQYLIPFFKDPRYLRVDGRPMLFVYRPSSIEFLSDYLDIWRSECAAVGLPPVYVVATLTRGSLSAQQYGMDAAVERPLHDWTAGAVPEQKGEVHPYRRINGSVLEYDQVANHYLQKSLTDPANTFRSLVPCWDNTARYGSDAYLLHNFNPPKFQQWLSGLISDAQLHLPADRRFVVVNAWNEWAEGAHLEPDLRFGYAYLNSVGRALANHEFHDLSPDCTHQNAPLTVAVDLDEALVNGLRSDKVACEKFFNCLRKAVESNHYRLVFTNRFLATRLRELGLPTEAISLEVSAPYKLIFNDLCYFQANSIEQLLWMAIRHPDYSIAGNMLNNPEFPLIRKASNFELHQPKHSAVWLRDMETPSTAFKVAPDAIFFSSEIVRTELYSAAAKETPNVSTIIRFHRSADPRLLIHALYSLYAQSACNVRPYIALQGFDDKLVETLRVKMNSIAWPINSEPVLLRYTPESGHQDLRATMLNQTLIAVPRGLTAFLDYDDILFPFAYRYLVSRLKTSGKAVSFGRVYMTIVDVDNGLVSERKPGFEQGFTYRDFFENNHAPLHSFMINLELLDLSKIEFHSEMKFMEDYYLTLQLFREENGDWESLSEMKYIGDYNHRIDSELNTLALVNVEEKNALLLNEEYQLCESRINELRTRIFMDSKFGVTSI